MTPETRSELLERLAQARTETDRIFGLVHPDALYERPIPERNRIIFYLGHLEAFDWNLFQPRLDGAKSIDPSFDKLFAFGIDPVDGGLPTDAPGDWPRESQVRAYLRKVREALDSKLGALGDGDGEERTETLLNVAIEHRLMHAETLAYMLHQLPYECKFRLAEPAPPEAGRSPGEAIRVPEGVALLGLSREDPAVFGWDNEFEQMVVSVPPFEIDRHKVTNGQFLEFIQAGGYRERSLWTEAGWQWKEQHGIAHPVFWARREGTYRYRGMFEETPLPLDAPVFVSHAEASAFAAWRGRRLPTEAEWSRFAGSNAITDGWEWTSTLFEPFPGFKPFPFYPGYSADFFDGKHFVLKGGSASTAPCMLRPSFRNWFQPHYQYLYAGFRCAGR